MPLTQQELNDIANLSAERTKKALLEACLFVLKSGFAAYTEFVALREVATHCAALIHSGAGRAPADRVSTS